ncbi:MULTISPECIES: pilus assembly protein TadG-related protein [Streptomyces]|uniref:Pilus assembly protein TadG-related protein n=1 Tax=Streptomyces fuscus TaxID=3048495 RepID=A0ABT7IX26_9ACTN|nr:MULTISPECIES: pilus assembly protein TadG-related protein [Streptomyces]MCM1973667.1 pilus assembly protein TadG-related protein [Streptomyces sp. G1]MDL2077150.1 pilus assembly protein TadG-related protein [Streptomyces fuscus]
MRSSRYGDTGQAFPIYITVVGGLLFLAFAYLAVGQAAANRNGAQTAADAAALAAAQDTRDQLADKWVEEILDPAQWQDIFDGFVPGLVPSCWRAEQLAAQNDAHVEACDQSGPLEYTVEVQMDKPVGDSIIPGTEGKYARATAIAVIEPRCGFEPLGEEAGEDELPVLSCKDRDWELDPEDLADLPGPEDLFDVHLAD